MNSRHGRWMAGFQSLNGNRWSVLVAVIALAVVLGINPVFAALQPGSDNNDVIWGRDNDNASTAFIQPAGVTAKQHLDNTDVLLGRGNGDLLIGKKGNDVIDGQSGDDILIGGVENFVAPNSDVLMGGSENDINIWAPGDGSDAFVGDSGFDTQILAPFVLQNGQPQLFTASAYGRVVPRVSISNKPQFRCEIAVAPASLGFRYVVRFFANNTLAVTIRLQDVEQVLCPSTSAGTVQIADLTSNTPTIFVEKPLGTYSKTLVGAILQAP